MLKKLFICFFILIFLTNCINKNRKVTNQITVTVPFLYDITSEMFCHDNKINIKNLIPNNSDPHTFSLTPNTRKDIEESLVIVQIGGHLDAWINKIDFNSDQTLITVSKSLNISNIDNFDPHVWQSPAQSKKIISYLKTNYQKLFPAEKDKIEQCTNIYLKKIDEEVLNLKKEIQKIPEQNKVIVTNHDALGYFGQEFGIDIIPILGISDEELPTIDKINVALKKIKGKKAKALFLESASNSEKLLEMISHETGLKIGGKLYADSIGTKEEGAGTLLNMWKLNVEALVKALK